MLTVSLDFPFLIVPSVFSTVYYLFLVTGILCLTGVVFANRMCLHSSPSNWYFMLSIRNVLA